MPKMVKEKKVLLSAYVKPENKEFLRLFSRSFNTSMAQVLDDILGEAFKPLKEDWSLLHAKNRLVKFVNEISTHIDNMGAKDGKSSILKIISDNNLDTKKGGKNEI